MATTARIRFILALAALATVLLRVEWITGYGRGTGVNKVSLSPLPVAILGAQGLQQVKETRRLQTMLHDVARATCVPGEFAADMGLMKSAVRGKKTKKNGELKSLWERCGSWAKGLEKVRGHHGPSPIITALSLLSLTARARVCVATLLTPNPLSLTPVVFPFGCRLGP